jgi:DNA topoisomerase IB
VTTTTARPARIRLRRSDPRHPGFRRERAGDGFVYRAPDGAEVTDPEVLDRLTGLVLPPAWEDVWICLWPNGHLQATGVDAAGRRQYRYHEAWTARRDREKFDRALRLGEILPDLRARLAADLGGRGLTGPRVLSCAVRLIDLGLFRVGGEEYAGENGSYGLATVLREHVRLRRGEAVFTYPAKSGVQGAQRVREPAVREVIAALKRRRDDNPELLGWWSPGDRRWRDVRSSHINTHLKELTGLDLSAKDFRTWHATVLLAGQLARLPEDLRPTARRRAVSRAYQDVATALGNTPAVTKASYVDPRVVDLFEEGMTVAAPDPAPAPAGAGAGDSGDQLVPTSVSVAVTELLRHA